MRAPGITYAFTGPKDVAGPTFEILSFPIQTSTAGVQLFVKWENLPKDKILVLTNVVLSGNPGATQAVTELRLLITRQGGELVTIALLWPVQVNDKLRYLNWQGSVYVMGNGIGQVAVQMQGSFSSGANSNALLGHIHGVVIPRGNAGAM